MMHRLFFISFLFKYKYKITYINFSKLSNLNFKIILPILKCTHIISKKILFFILNRSIHQQITN